MHSCFVAVWRCREEAEPGAFSVVGLGTVGAGSEAEWEAVEGVEAAVALVVAGVAEEEAGR